MSTTVNRFSSNAFDADRSFPLTIADLSVNVTATNLSLLGKNVTNYSQYIAENFVHLTENFAGPNPPSRPITGQLWWKQSASDPSISKKLFVYDGTNWLPVQGAAPDTTQPTVPETGDLWFDTANNKLYVWNGTAWQEIVFNGDITYPTDPNTTPPDTTVVGPGQLWYDLTTQTLYVWNGAQWMPLAFTDPNGDGSSVTNNTFVLYEMIGGDEMMLFKIDGQVIMILSPVDKVQSDLWDGVAPAGKPNLQTLFPNGLRRGVNYATSIKVNGVGIEYEGSSTVEASSTFHATYADYAEYYLADQPLIPGTITMLCEHDNHDIEMCTKEFSTDIFGIVSSNPAYILNSQLGANDNAVAIALAGRVPCRVVGKVKKGDRLVSSGVPGCAKAVSLNDLANPVLASFAVLGRALESFDGDGEGLVEVAVNSTVG